MTDIVSRILIGAQDVGCDLTTAEGRLDLDNWLRARLAEIADDHLRGLAGEMVKEWRHHMHAAARVAFLARHGLQARASSHAKEIFSLQDRRQ